MTIFILTETVAHASIAVNTTGNMAMCVISDSAGKVGRYGFNVAQVHSIARRECARHVEA